MFETAGILLVCAAGVGYMAVDAWRFHERRAIALALIASLAFVALGTSFLAFGQDFTGRDLRRDIGAWRSNCLTVGRDGAAVCGCDPQ